MGNKGTITIYLIVFTVINLTQRQRKLVIQRAYHEPEDKLKPMLRAVMAANGHLNPGYEFYAEFTVDPIRVDSMEVRDDDVSVVAYQEHRATR